MQCPKCGSSQPVTSKECSTCGIIFDRWQPRATRRTTSSSTPVPPPPPATAVDSTPAGIPTSYVMIAVFALIIVGFVWTKHVRNARAKSGNSTDALINQINNSGAKLRSDLQNRGSSAKRGGAVWASSVSPGSKLPADLDEAKIREMIEGCSFFQEDVGVEIPKRINAGSMTLGLNRAAAVGVAARDHLIEFDPPLEAARTGEIVNVSVTQYASAKVMVSDNGASYRFGLGRRHVQLTSTQMSGNTVTAAFTWSLDQNDAADLAPEGPNPSGGAEFRKSGGGWTLLRAWQKDSGLIHYICQ